MENQANKNNEIRKFADKIEYIVENNWRLSGIDKKKKIVGVEEWLLNFDTSEIKYMVSLLEFIDLQQGSDILSHLEDLSERMKSLFDEKIHDIKISSIGDSIASSSSKYYYDLKKNLGIDDSCFITLNEIKDNDDIDDLVFIDDFIGTGGQATKFYNLHLKNLKCNCYYFSLYGYRKGINYIKRNAKFVTVISIKEYTDKDKLFSQKSGLRSSERVKAIAKKYGKKLYPGHPLGYKNSQATICFPSNVPNNTLPIIWAGNHNEKPIDVSWRPLFERKKNTQKKSSLVTKPISFDPNKMGITHHLIDANDRLRIKSKLLCPNLDHPETVGLIKKLRDAKDLRVIHIFSYEEQEIGYMIVYPLEKDCVQKLLDKKYNSVADIQPNEIAKNWEIASGYYIAYLISFKEENRNIVTYAYKKFFYEKIRESTNDDIFIFAKLSKNTVKLIRKYNLKRIDKSASENSIHYHHISKNNIIEDYINSF